MLNVNVSGSERWETWTSHFSSLKSEIICSLCLMLFETLVSVAPQAYACSLVLLLWQQSQTLINDTCLVMFMSHVMPLLCWHPCSSLPLSLCFSIRSFFPPFMHLAGIYLSVKIFMALCCPSMCHRMAHQLAVTITRHWSVNAMNLFVVMNQRTGSEES